MELRQQYVEEYLHDVAIEQLMDDYSTNGYQVSRRDNIGDYTADLVARKGDEVVVIEVKSGQLTPDRRKQVAGIGDFVRAHKNHKFLVVLATAPKQKKIDIPNLDQLLCDYLTDNFPDALDQLSTRTRITAVSDAVVDELTVSPNDSIILKGTGLVEVELHYGSGEDDSVMEDVFPFSFEVALTHNPRRELELTDSDTNSIDIDVSSF